MEGNDPDIEAVPAGWNPKDWVSANAWDSSKEETILVEGRILTATYHRDKESIAVQIRTPDGNVRTTYLPKMAFKFEGKHYMDLPKAETDRQMEKTAALFIAAKGRSVKLQMFKPQY